MSTATALHPVSNDGLGAIALTEPFAVSVTIRGVSPLLFHRWSVEGVEEKARAAKGSKAKKSDNIETYVYRDAEGSLCLPTEYLRMAIVNAAKYRQDPRSPRKSAMDLFKAGIVSLTDLCSLGVKAWDYVDRRRVTVQRNGITRNRPALNTGWECTMQFQVVTPEYISVDALNETIQMAGRLIGVGDFRPTFGRFQVVNFELI